MAGIRFTQAQIQELADAIASGVLSTGHGDKRVQYRSLEAMRSTLRFMQRCNNSGSKRVTAGFAGHSRGDK